MNLKSSLTKKLLLTGAVLAVLVVSRPFLAGETTPFPHKPHVEEVDDCTSCHVLDKVKDAMGIKMDGCTECHDEGTPPYRSEKSPKGSIMFSHRLHVDAAECKDCHKTTAEDQPRAAGKPFMSPETCDKCHKDNDVEVNQSQCARCHGHIAAEIHPADHKGAWKLKHGKESQWRVFGGHGKDCSLCHGKDQCTTCHKAEKPRSHTGLWRMRTHGTSAAWDRNSCKVCHETGACIACHKSTPPINHMGAWETFHGLTASSVADTSCAVCHHPSYCATCHTAR